MSGEMFMNVAVFCEICELTVIVIGLVMSSGVPVLVEHNVIGSRFR